MRMYADIKFDREIDKKIHYISPGGYAMKVKGKIYEFDFCDFYANVDEDDPTVLLCEMRNLDTDAFPQAAEFEKVCNQVEEITEFFIYTGENTDAEIHPVDILRLDLWTNEFGKIHIPRKLLIGCLADKEV